MDNIRNFLFSKTVWVNIIGFSIMVMPYLTEHQLVRPEIAGPALAVLNVLMRRISSGKIVFLPKK